MSDSRVNGKETKKNKMSGAGIEDTDTILTIIEAVQKELENEWELEDKGRLHRKVMESLTKKMESGEPSYVTVKAYDNNRKKATENKDKEKEDKETEK